MYKITTSQHCTGVESYKTIQIRQKGHTAVEIRTHSVTFVLANYYCVRTSLPLKIMAFAFKCNSVNSNNLLIIVVICYNKSYITFVIDPPLATGSNYRITFKSKRHNLQRQRRPYTVVIC